MGDVTPDWEAEKMRLELQILDIQRNVKAGQLRLREIDTEQARIQENEQASDKAIRDLKERIKGIRPDPGEET